VPAGTLRVHGLAEWSRRSASHTGKRTRTV